MIAEWELSPEDGNDHYYSYVSQEGYH